MDSPVDYYSWCVKTSPSPATRITELLDQRMDTFLQHPYSTGTPRVRVNVIVDLSPDAKEFSTLLSQVQTILVKYIDDTSRPDCPVVIPESMDPSQLMRLITNEFTLDDKGRPDIIPKVLETTLKYSVRTWSPRFMDKLYSGANPIGAISELIIGVLNTNSHVYHVSPVFTLIEIRVLEEMCKLSGIPGGRGVFCPGGSYSNLHAMITARNTIFPEMITRGVNCPCDEASQYMSRKNSGPISIFTSAHSHYSIMKSAITLGIGSNCVYQIPPDENGKINVTSLRNALKTSMAKGERPFFIVSTAGTTVLGAFDPLEEVGKIAKEYGCWYHIDGSWGGSTIFSETHKSKMSGCEYADSIVVNPHKILGVPLLCSALLMKNPGALQKANSTQAGYLFHDNDFDLGDGTIGCGRRPDAFKMMMSWIYYGKHGFEERINLALEKTQYLRRQLLNAANFEGRFELVVLEPQFTNICFWYFPPDMSKEDVDMLRTTDYAAYHNKVSAITQNVHQKLREEGLFMVDYAPLQVFEGDVSRDLPVFWRVVFNHPKIKYSAIDLLLKRIDELGCWEGSVRE